jgi:hypothetical protein
MTDSHALLERHKPRLVYDSMEAYFADSAAIWTDSKANVLKRAAGPTIAKPPALSLDFLGTHTYADGTPVLAADVIGETTRDYAVHARALHADARYRDRIHGAVRRDAQGRRWLQYWCFYYYNDYQLAGPLLTGGKHEGDWEMVQIRLGAAEQPEEAVYAQHKGAERRAWRDVATAQGAPQTPLVYVARGSHAAYFAPGTHWTGTWFDHADGKGPKIAPALTDLGDPAPPWVAWPGSWGDTKPTGAPLDTASPRGPARHAQWSDPEALVRTAQATAAAPKPPAPAPIAAPTATARREDGHLKVAYEAPPGTRAIILAVRPAGSPQPAQTHAVPTQAAQGELELPLGAHHDGPLEVLVSAAAPAGGASPASAARLAPG